MALGEAETRLRAAAADEAVWSLANALAGAVTALDVAEAVALTGAPAADAAFANLAVVVKGSDRVLVFRQLNGRIGSRDLSADEPACDVIRNGVPLRFATLEAYARRYPAVVDLLRSAGLQAGVTIPLFGADGGTLGAVGFGWEATQAFESGQRRRLDLIARLVGLALDRAVASESWPQQAEELARVMDEMPDGFCSADAGFRVTSVNLQAAELLHATRQELLGASLFELFPDGPAGGFGRQFRLAMESGSAVTFEDYCAARNGWFEVRAWPGATGLNVYFTNIDARRSEERERAAALLEARQENSRLSLLEAISADLTGVSNRTEVYQRLVRGLVTTRLALWATVVVPRGDQLVRVAAAHRDSVLDALTKRLIGEYPQSLSGRSPAVPVHRSGRPVRLEQLVGQIIADLDESAGSAAYGRTLQLLGDGPGLVTPILLDGEVVAVVTSVRGRGEPYSDEEVDLMVQVAGRVGRHVDDARHAETQRETAGALQDASLPKTLPQISQLGLAAGYRAASEGVAVGGDWYDAMELPTGRVAAVVGDVAGHGVGAAALMAQMRNTLRAHLFSQLGLGESLLRLSQQLTQEMRGVFATVVCVEIDPQTGDLTWVSAGHPGPILVSEDGRSVHLAGEPAPPIGWMHSSLERPATEQRRTLAAGERLLLFTDGLIERRGVDIDIGITHLMLNAEQSCRMTASDACDTILRQAQAEPGAHDDDVCLLIADFLPQTRI